MNFSLSIVPAGDSSYEFIEQLVNSTSKLSVSSFDFSTGAKGGLIFFASSHSKLNF